MWVTLAGLKVDTEGFWASGGGAVAAVCCCRTDVYNVKCQIRQIGLRAGCCAEVLLRATSKGSRCAQTAPGTFIRPR
jgi:hypothetical protein